ncbi:MAG: peptide chain release factor I [Deltaproteobacteria bacterium GWA2_54_12]|nr:MAG: peptide chain release factor I [Deltaproteobacteria bacterium GWA2_54_12]
MIKITGSIWIDEGEVREEFIRASGPGGQHVNKASTAVQLRFNVDASPGLSSEVKARLKALAGQRLTGEGDIIITSRESRSREQNRQEALDKLVELIEKAAQRPRARRKTKPTKGSKERRLKEKAVRGAVKKMRTKKGEE